MSNELVSRHVLSDVRSKGELVMLYRISDLLSLVLVYRGEKFVHPYVVWVHNADTRSFFYGDYSENLSHAMEVFSFRAKREHSMIGRS